MAANQAVQSKDLSGQRGRASLIAVVVLGVAGSVFFSQTLGDQAEQSWRAQAEADAERLAATFTLLLDHSNGPLQSLATLFNGSGRVAADEFENTIAYLKGHRDGLFPQSMGFVTKSQPASCRQDDGCWMVAYSTDESGVLRPGSDVSRFGPMVATIDAALKNENELVIGPAFQRESGAQYSYYAVTIRNTRQFGVVLSLINYEELIERMYEEWVPYGMTLRLSASFPTGNGMSEMRHIAGPPEPPTESVRTINVPAEIDGATFDLAWDISSDYAGGPERRVTRYALTTGIFMALLVALFLWGRHRKQT